MAVSKHYKNVDPRWLAKELCDRSICAVRMAAVISDDEGIFAIGWNSPGEDGLGLHAEEHAISRANRRRLKGARITVAGFRRTSKVKSRPCLEKCFPRIVKVGITEIDYHAKDGRWATIKMDNV